MKSFTDPNTILQQEKRNNATFVVRIELLRQFAGAIKSRDSATQITLEGDATALLANGEAFAIPLDDFSDTHTITATPSYNSGSDDTTVVCSGSSFAASGLPGLHVAKRYTVSGGNVERCIEITPLKFEMEGETLNAWQASEVDLALENGDGFFANSADTGLFDNDDIFWARIYFGWKGASDRVLYFGGTVDRDEGEDDRYGKQFRVTVFGHLKELERYPGWLINDPARKLLTVRGFDVLQAQTSAEFVEGLREFKFNFPAKDFLSGLAINSVSDGTEPGWHVIKFRPPDLFQYDYGDWTELTAGQEDATLTASQGHYVKVNAPRDFDVDMRYLLFQSEIDGGKTRAGARGTASLQAANGAKLDLVHDFQHIVRVKGAANTDLSYDLNNDARVFKAVFDAANDELYLISNQKWESLECVLDAGFVGALDWDYSSGFDNFKALSVTDGTNDFAQSGLVTWDLPSDWNRTDIDFGGTIEVVRDVFILRITCASYTSGTANAYFVRRGLRLTSDDGLALDLKVSLATLSLEAFELDLIALNGASETEISTWKTNLAHHQLAENILDATGYGAGKRTLDELNYSLSAPVMSNYGQPPYPGFRKTVSALAVDTSTTPETVYLGIGDELWKVTEKSEFAFLDRLDGREGVEQEIFRLAFDASGNLHGVARRKKEPIVTEIGRSISTQAVAATVFRSTDLATITEQNAIEASGEPRLASGEFQFRVSTGPGGFSYVGQSTSPVVEAGENLIVPYPSTSHGLVNSGGHAFNRTSGLTSGVTGLSLSHEPSYRKAFGFYLINTIDQADYFRFEMGAPGFCVWDDTDEQWVFFYWDNPNDSRVSLVDYQGTITHHFALNDVTRQMLSGCMGDNHDLWVAEMQWDNFGATFPSDLSEGKIVKADLDTTNDFITQFNCAIDSIEASQSLSGNHGSWPKIRSCTILEMCFHSVENSLHGCILDRFTLQYHWFVYDIANAKLYSSQTGTGFNFNAGMQLTGFVHNTDDDKVYCVAVDRRYETLESVLLCADFDDARAAGSEIQIEQCSVVLAGETQHRAGIVAGSNGRLYGVSGDRQNALWQYDDNFYPRMTIADLGDKDLRETLNDTVQVLNRTMQSRADRTIRVVERDNYDGEKTLFEDRHVIRLDPLKTWPYYYDRVEVNWKNPVTDQSGLAAAGQGGWERRVLAISNDLIQSRGLAEVAAQEIFEYFNQLRQMIETENIALLDLEEYDRINYIMNTANRDISRNDFFKLVSLEFDPESLTLTTRGVK